MVVDLSKLGPMPADIQRALAEASKQDQGNLPIVLEQKFNMANYGLALDGDGNPLLTFDIPHPPGVERKLFPFAWEALDRYIATLQKFREEQGPKAE